MAKRKSSVTCENDGDYQRNNDNSRFSPITTLLPAIDHLNLFVVQCTFYAVVAVYSTYLTLRSVYSGEKMTASAYQMAASGNGVNGERHQRSSVVQRRRCLHIVYTRPRSEKGRLAIKAVKRRSVIEETMT